ncbi:MAG: 50S ribosomal protein L25 [Anaerolineae bacterium]|nr:50S ribosomal protein L25 [Anaerolineae bacterium]
MSEFAIKAQERNLTGKKVRPLRSQGLVPGIIYGPTMDPVNIQIPGRSLETLLMNAGGTNLIDISVAGDTHIVLARDVQRHVLRDDILHVDFFALRMDQKIATDVFLRFAGESPAVVSGQGILITGPGNLTIETLPANLINEIEISLDGLIEVGDGIHVRDLELGEDIDILNDPDEMLARVVMPAAVAAEDEEEELEGELDEEVDAADVERVGEDSEEEE